MIDNSSETGRYTERRCLTPAPRRDVPDAGTSFVDLRLGRATLKDAAIGSKSSLGQRRKAGPGLTEPDRGNRWQLMTAGHQPQEEEKLAPPIRIRRPRHRRQPRLRHRQPRMEVQLKRLEACGPTRQEPPDCRLDRRRRHRRHRQRRQPTRVRRRHHTRAQARCRRRRGLHNRDPNQPAFRRRLDRRHRYRDRTGPRRELTQRPARTFKIEPVNFEGRAWLGPTRRGQEARSRHQPPPWELCQHLNQRRRPRQGQAVLPEAQVDSRPGQRAPARDRAIPQPRGGQTHHPTIRGLSRRISHR